LEGIEKEKFEDGSWKLEARSEKKEEVQRKVCSRQSSIGNR